MTARDPALPNRDDGDTKGPLTVLQHTGLAVPDPELRVTGMAEMGVARGVAWRATVQLGATQVGWFENGGYGGATEFDPCDWDLFGQRDFERFAAACTLGGEPLAYHELVMEALVGEYELHEHVALARRRGVIPLRLADPYGFYPAQTFVRAMPTDARARKLLLIDLMVKYRGLEGRWEWWDGTAWCAIEASPIPPEVSKCK